MKILREIPGLDDVRCVLNKADSIALVCHVNPDGDTLGSALALSSALKRRGKKTAVFCQDPVPDYLMFMAGAEACRTPESAEGETFDLLLAIDVADVRRMGSCAGLMEQCRMTAQIDHHDTNPGYAQVNCVDAEAAATGQIIWKLIHDSFTTADEAVCIYTAIVTDTGNLSYGHLTEDTFRVVGEIAAMGLVDLPELNRMLFKQREAAALRLLGRALNSLTFHADGKITSMQLTQEDFRACGAGPEHADMIVNYGLDIRGVCMAVLARETGTPGEVKFSLRAVPPLKINGVAKHFGGGGHPQAAGATVCGDITQCVAECVRTMEKALRGEE